MCNYGDIVFYIIPFEIFACTGEAAPVELTYFLVHVMLA